MSSLAPVVDLSIVIPAYNEEQRIAPTLERLHRFLSAQPYRYEIVVVDDGSADGTADLVERMAADLPGLRCIRSTPNRGKGSAVRLGMLDAHGAIRLMCDADGSMPPEEMPKLLKQIATGAIDIAIGSRYVDGAATGERQPLYRRVWSRIANRAVQAALVRGVRDTSAASRRSPRRRRWTCSRAPASTAGHSTSRSSPWRAGAAWRSPRSASPGPTTSARASTRSRICGRSSARRRPSAGT